MYATWNPATYPQPYTNLAFIAELSKYTMSQSKNLSTKTKLIHSHQILYKWGHPVKLGDTKDNKSFSISTLDEGLSLLRQWNILELQEQCPQCRQCQNYNRGDWDDLDPP